MIDFNKIVNKVCKKWWKIVFKSEIFEIIDPEKKPQYTSYLNKTIYRLRAENLIISLKAGVYIIPDSEDMSLNRVDLIDKYYLKFLKKSITAFVWASYYISGKKSLEFHLKDYSIPEKVVVVNRSINKKIKIWDYQIVFKTIAWKVSGKKQNLYSRLSDFTTIKRIDNIEFKISSLELALVESALVSDSMEWVDFTLLNKAVKKYSEVLDIDVFYEIGKMKFIMSFNRLKEIAKHIDRDLYEVYLDIIKKNGWLFIWEWLRGF